MKIPKWIVGLILLVYWVGSMDYIMYLANTNSDFGVLLAFTWFVVNAYLTFKIFKFT